MSIVIALDAMGGDDAPEIVVDGAALALARHPDLQFIMIGDGEQIRPLLAKHADLEKSVDLRHTAQYVSSDMKPSAALRQGRDTSMCLAINAVRDHEAAAAVSAGNTGALMAFAMFVLRTLENIDRPAIASILPARHKPVVVLDLGANVDCTAENLFQFAVMGEVYARAVLGVSKPSVGLLNVGTEEVKGDNVVREAAALVRDSGLPIDYAGFVEGTDVINGKVDVVVTDGFTGNVALKVVEGTASMFSQALREAFSSTIWTKIGYLFARPALDKLRDNFDPRLYNGAMFLGINGVVVKSHGGTDALGFSSAINAAVELVKQGTNERIIDEMSSVTSGDAPAAVAVK